MNCHFRIISDESDDFVFEILIDDNATFYDLHLFIQYKLNLDPSQITSFFITDNGWNRDKEITLLDMSDGENAPQYVMDSVKLKDLIVQKRQRLQYVFDLLSNRTLFMEVIGIGNIQSAKVPACLRLFGELPALAPVDFNLSVEPDSFDDDDAMLSDVDFSDEEIDSDYLSDIHDFDDEYF